MPTPITPRIDQPQVRVPATSTRRPGVAQPRTTPGMAGDQRVQGPRSVARPAAPTPVGPVEPPAPPPAADPTEALRLARAGQPVRLKVRDGEPVGLAIRELLPRDGRPAFELGLGGGRFELVAAPAGDTDAALARAVVMAAAFPPEVRKALRRITITEPAAERLAYKLELADASGAIEAFTVVREGVAVPVPASCGCPTCHAGSVCTAEPVAPPAVKPVMYTLSDGAASLTLATTPDASDDWEVAQSLLLWTQLPASMRGVLKQVHTVDGPNPTDAEWAKTYNSPNFTSAASGGNGAATFWNGTGNLTAEYFFHEFGHVLGQTLSTTPDMVPDGWAEAKQADGNAVSNYGQASINEDFAEAFAVLMAVRLGQLPRVGNPPATPAEFAERFPHRAALLDAIFRGERRPVLR